ncbi:MAG: hypothetical protein DYG98_02965 [Haliscomenobacteraceae bacterium CHB4]|nr:hypothetical protein [Haliscomenobacteraceae bacterium CHB4]
MEPKISKAQLSVWEWKEKAYEEIKHLPIMEQMRVIHERTKQTVAQINANKKSLSKTQPKS